MSKLKVGDKVELKDSYFGYFGNYKGQTLTVSKIIPKDSSIDETCVMIEEFSDSAPQHLVRQSAFKKVKK